MTRKKASSLLSILLCATILLLPASGFCWFGSKKNTTTGVMPEFSLESPDGADVISRDQFQGKVVLVNFWATWCGPCVAEFPELQKLHDDLKKQGFSLLGISDDKRANDVVKFLQRNGYTFPIAMATTTVKRQFGAGAGLPVSFLVDRKGKIIKKYYGPRPYDTFRRDIEKLL